MFDPQTKPVPYIANFYENLYRAPPSEDTTNDRIVEDFLGEAICNSDMLRNSKLKTQEVAVLEQPLSVKELDKSIKKL